MRHQLKGKKLNRTASHRSATLRSLSIALIKNERIVTTTTKAKELRRIIEPIITRAKDDTTHNRREVFSFLHDNKSTSKLFDEIAPKCASRPGGYTRVIKLGTRQGDGAEIAVIELVDYNDVRPDSAGTKKKKSTRRGGKSKSGAAPAAAAPATVVETVAETAAEVVEEVKETVADVAETVTETVEEVVEAVEEKVEEVTGAAEEAPEASDDTTDTEEKKEN
jgi:large subunit ribosomal protein L17